MHTCWSIKINESVAIDILPWLLRGRILCFALHFSLDSFSLFKLNSCHLCAWTIKLPTPALICTMHSFSPFSPLKSIDCFHSLIIFNGKNWSHLNTEACTAVPTARAAVLPFLPYQRLLTGYSYCSLGYHSGYQHSASTNMASRWDTQVAMLVALC